MKLLDIIGREHTIISKDLQNYEKDLKNIIKNSKFLVIGGGGSIGRSLCKLLFQYNAKLLHAVDLSENGLVELVRNLRSSIGYNRGEFDTFAIDCGDKYFENFCQANNYDYVLNLSAMKHVRSENSPFSMLRMFKTNVLNAISTYQISEKIPAIKYFCVSTDKAANPANFMGATKRAMELCLMIKDNLTPISSARFANVAFSDGSLLDGFSRRLELGQPISAPKDIKRFFITEDEAGLICLFSCIFGETNEIFFPYNDNEIKLINFSEILERFLLVKGKKMIVFDSEEEARNACSTLDLTVSCPVFLFNSDTVGEKPLEEFYTSEEKIYNSKYKDMASVKFFSKKNKDDINKFIEKFCKIDPSSKNAKRKMIETLEWFIPNFQHVSGDRYLNQRM